MMSTGGIIAVVFLVVMIVLVVLGTRGGGPPRAGSGDFDKTGYGGEGGGD